MMQAIRIRRAYGSSQIGQDAGLTGAGRETPFLDSGATLVVNWVGDDGHDDGLIHSHGWAMGSGVGQPARV